MIKHPLPHHCHPNRPLESVDGLIVHFISDRYRHPREPFSLDHIVDLLSGFGYSYHWLILRDGSLVELLPPHLEAWHAGRSRLHGRDWCNRFTHGVALVGGTGWEYEEAQIITLAQLAAQDMTEHQYRASWIAGHEDVRKEWNEAYPDRADKPKPDPGDLFPWLQLHDMLEGADLDVKLGEK